MYCGHTLPNGEHCLVGFIFPNCQYQGGSRVGVGVQVVNLLPLGRVGHRPVLPQPVSGGTLRLRRLPSAISCSYTSTWPALALMPFLSGLFWYQLGRVMKCPIACSYQLQQFS